MEGDIHDVERIAKILNLFQKNLPVKLRVTGDEQSAIASEEVLNCSGVGTVKLRICDRLIEWKK